MKKTRRIMSIILSVAIVLSFATISMAGVSAKEATELSVTIDTGEKVTITDRDGDSFFEIRTADELFAFSYLVNYGNTKINAILEQDIVVNEDIVDENSTDARVWTPIGNNQEHRYNGTFDGNGKTISGLYLNDNSKDYVGLFGLTNEDSIIKNVTVLNSYILGEKYVGGIVGENIGVVEFCQYSGNVNGRAFVGGIVGDNYGMIIVCINTGKVSGIESVGGIVGVNSNRVQLCYNTGDVKGYKNVGAIVGYDFDEWNETLVKDCYYLNTTCVDNSFGEPKSAEQFANGEVAYLMGNPYGQKIGTDNLPVFFGEKIYCATDAYDTSKQIFSNTAIEGVTYEPAFDSNNNGYYEIDNPSKLYWFVEQVNNGSTDINAILTANITVNEDVIDENSTDARVWTPIGKNYECKYKGTFDGNGKIISGLYLNDSTLDSVGLFGVTSEKSIIKNVTLENYYFCGEKSVGGIVGENYGLLKNCHTSGKVQGNYFVGGIVGDNLGTIQTSHNKSFVSGNEYIGGIAGINSRTIEKCYNSEKVSGFAHIGGIVGINSDELFGEVSVKNCYYIKNTCTGGIDGKDIEGSAEIFSSSREVG